MDEILRCWFPSGEIVSFEDSTEKKEGKRKFSMPRGEKGSLLKNFGEVELASTRTHATGENARVSRCGGKRTVFLFLFRTVQD